jgi:LacI family transcriptional regulator
MKSSAGSPTFRQLAQLAGVSIATVSLALRNHPSLPLKTRRKIQRLAKQTGYRYDPLVARLMTQLRTNRVKRSTDVLAFLTTWPTRHDERVYLSEGTHHTNYLAGIRDRATKLGYDIDEFWTKEPGLTSKRLSRILQARGIRGIIIPPLIRSRGHVSLDWQYFATVALSFTIVKPDTHRVCHSCYNGMQLALRRLKQRGYRRPGFATHFEQSDRVNSSWLGSYLAHQFTLPAKAKIAPLLSRKLTHEEMKTWVEKYQPDVILSNISVPYRLLKDLGYDIPRDIGFASLDRGAEIAATPLNLAGIDQQDFQQGVAAVNLVVEQIQNNTLGLPSTPVTLHVDGIWQDGKTVRTASRSSTE